MDKARAWRLGVPLAVVTLTLACHLPAVRNGFVNWDDPENIIENPHIRSLDGENLKWMFTNMHGLYMPLTWLSHGIDHAMWKLNPLGHHLTSVLLHGLNALLCFMLMVSLLQSDDPRTRVAAALAALLWSLHPLRVESVAWVTERRDVLSGVFAFGCVLAYLRAHRGPRSYGWLGASLALFALSLLSKASALMLPVVLLVIDWQVLRRLRAETRMRALIEKTPYVAIAGAALVMAWFAQESARAITDVDPLARAMEPTRRLAFYAAKVVLPIYLSPHYYFHRGITATGTNIGSLLACLGVLAGLVAFRKSAPGLIAVAACCVALLAPVLGFPQIGSHFAADRYTYLAAVPISVLLAAGLLNSMSVGRARMVAIAAIAVCSLLTVSQIGAWHTSIDLWTCAIRRDAQDHMAYRSRAAAWQAMNKRSEAMRDYDAAIVAKPDVALLYIDRGDLHRQNGDLNAAFRDFREAAKIDVHDPVPHANIGVLCELDGKSDLAIQAYTNALNLGGPEWPGRARVEKSLRALRKDRR